MSFATGFFRKATERIEDNEQLFRKYLSDGLVTARSNIPKHRQVEENIATMIQDVRDIKQNVTGGSAIPDDFFYVLAANGGGTGLDIATVKNNVLQAKLKNQALSADELQAMINLNGFSAPDNKSLKENLSDLFGLTIQKEKEDTGPKDDSSFLKNAVLAGFQLNPKMRAENYLKTASLEGLPVNQLLLDTFGQKQRVEGIERVTVDKGISVFGSQPDLLSEIAAAAKQFSTQVDSVIERKYADIGYFDNLGGFTTRTAEGESYFEDNKISRSQLKAESKTLSRQVGQLYVELAGGKSPTEKNKIINIFNNVLDKVQARTVEGLFKEELGSANFENNVLNSLREAVTGEKKINASSSSIEKDSSLQELYGFVPGQTSELQSLLDTIKGNEKKKDQVVNGSEITETPLTKVYESAKTQYQDIRNQIVSEKDINQDLKKILNEQPRAKKIRHPSLEKGEYQITRTRGIIYLIPENKTQDAYIIDVNSNKIKKLPQQLDKVQIVDEEGTPIINRAQKGAAGTAYDSSFLRGLLTLDDAARKLKKEDAQRFRDLRNAYNDVFGDLYYNSGNLKIPASYNQGGLMSRRK